MSDLDSFNSNRSGTAEAELLEELDSYRRRIRELERILDERDLQEVADRREMSRVAGAFHPAKIRAWCWTAEARLTQYLPIRGDVRDAWGQSVNETSLAEEQLLQAIHPDDRERLAGAWDRAYEEHEPYEIEYRLVLSDGDVRHNHEIGMPEFDGSGRYLGHFGTTQDITERKRSEVAWREAHHTLEQRVRERTVELEREIMNRERAQESLRGSEASLKAAQRLAKLGHWRWDYKKQRLTDWSEEKARLFGFAADQGKLTYDDISRSLHPDDRDRVLKAYRTADEETQDFEIDYRILTSEGEVRHLHEIGKVEYDDRGERIAHVGTVQDITEQKHAGMALRDSEARFAGILDIAPEAIISVDEGQCIQLFNQGAEAIFGYSADEVLGQSLVMLLPSRFKETHSKKVEEFARAPEISRLMQERGDVFGLRKDGTEFPAEASISKLERGGETVFTIMLRDITEHKQAEEALRASEYVLQERVADLEEVKRQLENRGESLTRLADDLLIACHEARAADRAKSEFLAAMSHELRTPLNAIIGFSEVIVNELFGPVGSVRYREYGSDIHESGLHLLGLINDILDLSKIEFGTDELHEDTIEIPEIVRSTLKLVGQRAELGGIKLELDLSDQLPALRADERKLKQILVNLLSNAIKFTDAGGEVTLKAWCRMDSGHVFQIVDTGIGIAPEDIAKALSRFGQVDGDLNRKYEGTGLGLPLTKALVELHGGVFDLQSKVGVGTTVTVHFPAARIVASFDNAGLLSVEGKAAS